MEEKVAHGEAFSNARELVRFLNDNKIPKEAITSILENKGQIFLIYYTND